MREYNFDGLVGPTHSYAGLSPGSISGLYQINIRIPANTADGNIPVILRIGGQSTQSNAIIPVKR